MDNLRKQADMTHSTCSLPDCEKPTKRAGYCYGHYMKNWRYGTPTPNHEPKWTDLTGKRFGCLIVIERRSGVLWLCQCDCGDTTLTRTGDLNRGSAASCGDKTLHHRSDDIGYSMAHDRVRTDRGNVKHYPCVNCGTEAQHWSYDHTDPDEMHDLNISAHPVAYSPRPEHYSPRCVKCHRRFDLDHRDAHAGPYRP